MDLDKVNDYLADIYDDEDIITREEVIAASTIEDFLPLIANDVARFVRLLIKIKGAKNILEIGTSIGFSAITMADALGEGEGSVTTVDYNEKVVEQARLNFEKFGVADKIEIKLGNARDVVPALTGKYDLILQDSGKGLYPDLLEDCIRLLQPGGLLLADNTLFPIMDLAPQVAHFIPPIDKFNQMVKDDARLESTILPLGEGFTLARKK